MTTLEVLASGRAKIGVVGLGYVGLPLLVALQRHFSVCGYDRDERRVQALRGGVDRTMSVPEAELAAVRRVVTSDPAALRPCRFVIIAVPTPITAARSPDLEPLKDAARTVGTHLSPEAVVVVESTVYPGVTEEVVGPILADESGLRGGADFHLGYSPERVNPGDSAHSLERIPKVVAGENRAVTDLMAAVYGTVVRDVHRVAGIRTAEAAKVLENTQRDVNIALINEAAMVFDRLGVDTGEVLRTAGTKWNFVRFQPGLVGGHCIGTDSYYFVHAAEQVGHTPRVVLAGRQVNDGMGRYVAERTVALIVSHGTAAQQARVLILGCTFKENVPDTRNTRVADIVHALEEQCVHCSVFDPEAHADEVRARYGFDLIDAADRDAPYDAIIVAVKHRVFTVLFPVATLRSLCVAGNAVLIDVKSMYDRDEVEAAGMTYWRL